MEKKTQEAIVSINRFQELLALCNSAEKPNAKAREELQNLIKSLPICKAAIQRQEGMYAVAVSTSIERLQSSDAFKEVLYKMFSTAGRLRIRNCKLIREPCH